jgi:hypothetical protein
MIQLVSVDTPTARGAALVANARELVPELRSRAAETGQLRMLPELTVQDLKRLNYVGATVPRRAGRARARYRRRLPDDRRTIPGLEATVPDSPGQERPDQDGRVLDGLRRKPALGVQV